MGIVASVVSIVSAIGATGGISLGAFALGSGGMLGGLLYGGVALVKNLSKKKSITGNSPTYQWGALQTQTNNQLPVALIYGKNKLAGNRIWQQLRSNNTIIDRLIAFGEGEIESISDVRLNDMPYSKAGATLRTYLGTASQGVDALVPGETQSDKINVVGSLKHLAYVALTLKATENIRSDYNLTAVIKGRKVRVYSDLNTYVIQYSNNPAWCLLDFLIAYNGCAIGLNPDGTHNENVIQEFIDIEAFIEAANYCDEIVNGAPRFTFNMIIDAQSQRRDIIEEFKKACRGALVIKGKQLQLKIDKGSSPVKSIGAEDIIADSERFWTIPREENYDRIIIKYRSEENDWAVIEAIAEKEQFDNVPPMEHTVDILSVLNHQQASALAWYYLNKAKLEKYFGYFETDYRAFDLEIGDVITLSENLMNFQSKQVKITKVIDKSDGTFGVFWREYNPSLYTDAMGSLTATVTRTDLDNIYEEPPCPESFSAAQVFDTIQMSWLKVDGVGVTYEIREGESWELSKPVVKGVENETANIPVFSTGIKKYFIKSKSQHGIYSEAAQSDVVYVGDIPHTNLVFDENMLYENGAMTGGYLYQGQLKGNPTGGTWSAIPDILWGEEDLAVGGLWGAATCSESATYESNVHDIGAFTENIVSLNYDFYSIDETAAIKVEWAFSEDNINYCDWRVFCDGVHKFRYFKFRFTIINPYGQQFMLSCPIAHIDVPDRDEYYCDIEINSAASGVIIDFATHAQSSKSQPFIVVPAVVANISGAQAAYCVVESKTLESATIKAYDYNGAATTAVLDVRVKGY